jgi:hypothetical protein
MKERKVDPYTLKEFTPTRKNQKFASEQNKIEFNNEKARKERLIRKEVDSKILKNYRILKSKIEDEQQVIVHEAEVIREGFDYRFINHFKKIKYKGEDQQVLGIYDLFYFIDNPSKSVIIIKNQEDVIH